MVPFLFQAENPRSLVTSIPLDSRSSPLPFQGHICGQLLEIPIELPAQNGDLTSCFQIQFINDYIRNVFASFVKLLLKDNHYYLVQ